VRAGAFRTLAKLEPADLAKSLPEPLLKGLTDPDESVRRAAIGAVCRLPPDVLAPNAAQVLRMLWDSSWLVREEAMQRTGEMLSQLRASPLREQLRRAAVEACLDGSAAD
jgi:HEAT repeat protein